MDQHGPCDAVRRNYVAHYRSNTSPELEDRVGKGHRMRVPFAVVELEDVALLQDLPVQVLCVQMKRADLEVGQLFLGRDANPEVSVRLILLLAGRPVLHAHHFGKVERLRQHDDCTDTLLPHESPKVGDRLLRRALRHDVRIRLEEALQRDSRG